MTTPLDEILQRHVSHAGQLSLVTSVLGASASWYAHSLIAKTLSSTGNDDSNAVVIHISFVHDATFHIDCVRKLGNIDLRQHARKGRYHFIDGLSALFFQPPGAGAKKQQEATGALSFVGQNVQAMSADITARIRKALTPLADGVKAHLVVENPDVLLAAGELSSVGLVGELLRWHELVFCTTVMVNADSAMVSRVRTRLEMEAASFVITLAHQAHTTSSLRMLDTGLAKDVSGVLRVTTAPGTDTDQQDQQWNDKEVLYFVKDSSVEVFNRGQLRA